MSPLWNDWTGYKGCWRLIGQADELARSEHMLRLKVTTERWTWHWEEKRLRCGTLTTPGRFLVGSSPRAGKCLAPPWIKGQASDSSRGNCRAECPRRRSSFEAGDGSAQVTSGALEEVCKRPEDGYEEKKK